ncbi:ABC transporter permease subunit [Fundicoccus culcitae]|uniref:ABC transporter permease subunit n=1 Tax=Fundicoccus culcitae TaxID=2969821 RepID=A0ABY5P2U7_9LACT|nr:ABC transporter permease subunit [Fundicoccus culcitae]UUX33027.1 ABC transporter permease subunit [Fundicoccus culcitae]
MFRLIRSEFYQLLKSRSFYIFSLAAILLTLLTVLGIYYGNTYEEGTEILIRMFVTPDLILEIYGGILTFVGPYICFIVAIIAFSDEIKLRTFINSISFGIPRYKIYLSKFLMSLFLGIIGISLSYLTLVISYQVLIGGPSQPFIDFILDFIVMHIPLWAAYLSLFILFRFMFSSGAIDMLIIMLWSFLPLILSTINRPWVQSIRPYLINELALPSQTSWLGIDQTIYISFAYVIVLLALGIFLFNRKEI